MILLADLLPSHIILRVACMGCGGLWWAKKVHSPEITYMHLATRSWRYALHLLLELPTFSGIYALKLCLELATRSWCYALNLRRAWNFQRALHVIVVICSWNFQHALEFRLWIYSWNLQHALGVTLLVLRCLPPGLDKKVRYWFADAVAMYVHGIKCFKNMFKFPKSLTLSWPCLTPLSPKKVKIFMSIGSFQPP